MYVNGTQKLLAEAVSLREFLVGEGFNIDRVAVEKNGVIIPKRNYDSEMLNDEDKIEVVSFVGGG